MRYSHSHPANDLPRTGNIATIPHLPAESTEITDEERELVCTAIDKRGLWNTDLPLILGLVER